MKIIKAGVEGPEREIIDIPEPNFWPFTLPVTEPEPVKEPVTAPVEEPETVPA